MALIEELNKQGNTLFKHRSKLPIPFAIIGLMIYLFNIKFGGKEEHTMLFEIGCLCIGLGGQIIRAITIGYTPKGTSGRNTEKQVAEQLNTKGMYSIMRNPLYLGNFFMWFALILFIDCHWFSILFILCFWMYYERIIFAEEFFLSKKYGETYLNWTRQTPVFLPKINNWEKPSLGFSFKNVLKREYSGFFALFFCFALFDILEQYTRYYSWELDPFWMNALIISGLISLSLRTIKKYTQFLHVEGR